MAFSAAGQRVLITGSSSIETIVRNAPMQPVPETNHTEPWLLKRQHYLTPTDHARCSGWALGMFLSVFLAMGLGVAANAEAQR